MFGSPPGIGFLFASHPHSTKLQHAEDSTIQSDTLLAEENRTPAGDFDSHRDENEDRGTNQKNEDRENQVKGAFLKEIRSGFRERGLQIQHVDPSQINQTI